MYYKEGIKSFISKQAGIGFKKDKIYNCYTDEYIKDWARSWDENFAPENFDFKKLPSNFKFDHYINFQTGEIQ